MKYKTELFLSATLLVGYQKATVEETTKFLDDNGFQYVHVDNDGRIHALSKSNQMFEGYRVYKKRIPDFS